MQPFHFFYPFFQKYCYIYNENATGVFMKKKKEKYMPPTDGSMKLSKYALWRLKHPNGIPVIIHDMRAVMR